ncbi:MAG: hypothetical protein AAF211_28870 [Myxococcota bacterium]
MNDLLLLLRRIRDGHADLAEVERARALVREDARLDDELRAIALTDDDDPSGDAAGLLAVLGADDLGTLLADAIAHEAGPAEPIDEAALRDQGWTMGPQVAAAVLAEAGHVEIVRPVLAACGLATGLPIAAAVRSEAGSIDVTPQLRDAIPWPHVNVATAVRAEAGSIDVVARVMEAIARPSVIAAPRSEIARPANDTRAFAAVGLVLAAAVALFVSLAGIETTPDASLPTLAFAHADEVVVEDLTSDTDVLVLQGGGQDGALILWVDEET